MAKAALEKVVQAAADDPAAARHGERFDGPEGWAAAADGYSKPNVSSPVLLAEYKKVLGERYRHPLHLFRGRLSPGRVFLIFCGMMVLQLLTLPQKGDRTRESLLRVLRSVPARHVLCDTGDPFASAERGNLLGACRFAARRRAGVR